MATHLSIVTPESPIVELDVDSVVIPGTEGQFGVLAEHEAFLAPLRAGVVEYRVAGETHRVAVSGGFAEVTQERATILARTAEVSNQIDRARAEQAVDRARNELERIGVQSPPEEVQIARDELDRAEARLNAAE